MIMAKHRSNRIKKDKAIHHSNQKKILKKKKHNNLQEIFLWGVLRDTEKIVLMGFPQVEGYLVYVLLYHIAAKAVIVNMGGDKLS